MMELCTPLVEQGGCDTVFVMPNLTPKVGSVSEALQYHEKLQKIAPNVKFLMSLYLHTGLTEEEIEKAAKSEVIYGVNTQPPIIESIVIVTKLLSRSNSTLPV
jgi:dihydroorotase